LQNKVFYLNIGYNVSTAVLHNAFQMLLLVATGNKTSQQENCSASIPGPRTGTFWSILEVYQITWCRITEI